MVDVALVLVSAIIGIIVGIISGALFTVGKIIWNERKAKKQFETKENLFEVADKPSENIKPKKMEKQTNKKEKGFFKKLFKK